MFTHRRLVVAAAALVCLTTGCWLQAADGPGLTAWNPAETQITSSTVSSLGIAWQHTLANSNLTEPLINQGATYVGSPGSLTALDLDTGATRWNTLGNGQPTLVNGRIDLQQGCTVHEIDTATGNVVGTAPLGDIGGITLGNGACTEYTGAAGSVVGSWSEAIMTNGSACHSMGLPTWITASGTELLGKWDLWQSSGPICTSTSPAIPPIPGGAAVTIGTTIVLADAGNGVIARRSDNGAPVWTQDVGSPVVSMADAGTSRIAAVTADGHIVVLDAATGAPQWSAQPATSSSDLSRLATTASTIFVVTSTGALDAYPITGCGGPTCSSSWTATVASPLRGGPSIGGDVLYVGGSDGSVTAFPANGCGHATCASSWTTTVAHGAAEGMSVSDGHLLVASADGTVTAFTPQPAGP